MVMFFKGKLGEGVLNSKTGVEFLDIEFAQGADDYSQK